MRTERIVSNFESVDRGERAGRMVWYSGAAVYRFDWWSGSEYMLTLSLDPKHVDMSRMKGAPFNRDHDRSLSAQIGVIESAWIEKGKGYAEYRLADTPDVDDVAQKIATKIHRHTSIEAFVNETKDVTPKGDKIKRLMAVDWQPQAVALVQVPADPNAQLFSEEDSREIWLPDGLYTHKFSETGAASEEVGRVPSRHMLAALLCRR